MFAKIFSRSKPFRVFGIVLVFSTGSNSGTYFLIGATLKTSILTFWLSWSSLVLGVFNHADYFGKAVFKKIDYVEENPKQKANGPNFVDVIVKNIAYDAKKAPNARIRVAIWSAEEQKNYAKEEIAPTRAVSIEARLAVDKTLIFRFSGMKNGEKYAFFVHDDKENTGKVRRRFGIFPIDPYTFSNAKTNGKPLRREGLKEPRFESTAIAYETLGQKIILDLK